MDLHLFQIILLFNYSVGYALPERMHWCPLDDHRLLVAVSPLAVPPDWDSTHPGERIPSSCQSSSAK